LPDPDPDLKIFETGAESESEKVTPATSAAEVGPDPDYRSRLRLDSAFFFRSQIRTRSQKFVENRIRNRSHFSISAVAGVCAVNS